jgi:hypothetical protein
LRYSSIWTTNKVCQKLSGQRILPPVAQSKVSTPLLPETPHLLEPGRGRRSQIAALVLALAQAAMQAQRNQQCRVFSSSPHWRKASEPHAEPTMCGIAPLAYEKRYIGEMEHQRRTRRTKEDVSKDWLMSAGGPEILISSALGIDDRWYIRPPESFWPITVAIVDSDAPCDYGSRS